MPPLLTLIPALGLAAAMAVYAFEPVRCEWTERWRARRKPAPRLRAGA